MASHSIFDAESSAANVYFAIMKEDGTVWNTVSFETFNNANSDTFYGINMTQVGTMGLWKGTVPPALPSGDYFFLTFQRVGGSKSLQADSRIDGEKLTWDGTSLTKPTSQVNIFATLDTAVPELSAVPAATAGVRSMIKLVYQWLRNNTTQTSTVRQIRNDAGTVIGSATVSDTGSTTEQGKLA